MTLRLWQTRKKKHQDIQEKCRQWKGEEKANHYLQKNTKYMVPIEIKSGRSELRTGRIKMTWSQNFTYRGRILPGDGKWVTECRRRIGIAKTVFKNVEQSTKKYNNFVRKNNKAEILCIIKHFIWHWMQKTYLTREEITGDNRIMALQKDVEYNIDRRWKQCHIYKNGAYTRSE